MKVSTEHRELLGKWISQVMKDRNVTKSEWDERYAGYTEQRKIWDLYNAVMANSVMARELIRPIFNEYDDSHTETALKSIYKSL